MSSKLKALLLIGGRGQRIGFEKHRLRLNGDSLLEKQIQLFQTEGYPVLLAHRDDQILPPDITCLSIETITDSPSHVGPMAGIVAAHHRFPDTSLFVLACDMPGVDSSAIRFLIAARKSAKDVTCLRDDTRIHPLFSIWEPSGLKKLVSKTDPKLQNSIEAMDTNVVLSPQKSWLSNINTPQDLTRHTGLAR